MSDWKPSPRRWGYYEEGDEDETEVKLPQRSLASKEPQKQLEPAEAEDFEEAEVGVEERLVRQVGRVLGDLSGQSPQYSGIDWAAAAYQDGSGRSVCYATSNEGFGFLPWGLRWPLEARPVFGLSTAEACAIPWQGLANPSRVIVDHYQLLRTQDPSLRLVALGASAPVGEAVRSFTREHGARLVGGEAGGAGARRGAHRLETVEKEAFAAARAVPEANRWSRGTAFLMGAMQECAAGLPHPGLADIADRASHGDVSRDDLAFMQQAVQYVRVQAQSLRVPDERLGSVQPVRTGPQRFDADALPAGGVMGYAVSFQHARVCVILERIVVGWVEGRDLAADELAELAYEHYCVVESVAATMEVLRCVS